MEGGPAAALLAPRGRVMILSRTLEASNRISMTLYIHAAKLQCARDMFSKLTTGVT